MWCSLLQNKALTAWVLFFLPVTLTLGFWQLNRAEEKNSLLNAMAQTDQRITVIASDDLTQFTNFQKVSLEGGFISDSIWLHDNKTWQGKAGVDVIAPIRFGNKWLLVNLGWLRWADRATLPKVNLTSQPLRLQGRLVYPTQDAFVLAEDEWQATSPRLIQRIDMASMAAHVGTEIWPQMLYLDAASEGVLQSHWQPINMGPEKHYGYAVQWFGLALVLFVLYSYRMYQFSRQHR